MANLDKNFKEKDNDSIVNYIYILEMISCNFNLKESRTKRTNMWINKYIIDTTSLILLKEQCNYIMLSKEEKHVMMFLPLLNLMNYLNIGNECSKIWNFE